MFFNYLITVVSLSYIADCAIDDYRFVSEIDGFLKLHRFPAKWQEARLRCHLEGGILASPTDPSIAGAMTDILKKEGPDRVYTGIHATYSDGDFTTITGIPLSQLDVQWKDEPSNYDGTQNCLNMFQSKGLAAVDCTLKFPFFCYKSVEKINSQKCGIEYPNSDYKLDNRTGSCYKLHKEEWPWQRAFKTCIAEDGYLAIINSRAESFVLSEILKEIPDSNRRTASIGFIKWQEFGDWFTIHGQSLDEAGFSTFGPGEPNNAGNNEWCGSVFSSGLLNDHACIVPLPFVCEKSPSQKHDQQIELQEHFK